MKLKAKRW